jgi:hypothetical protein
MVLGVDVAACWMRGLAAGQGYQIQRCRRVTTHEHQTGAVGGVMQAAQAAALWAAIGWSSSSHPWSIAQTPLLRQNR